METPLAARAACAIVALAACGTAHAVQRTFVASYGLTANTAFNCSVTKPCRAFGEAIGVTSPAGEVIVLDSAGYGPVTISQSVSIVAPPGVYAGITVSSGDGVVVNAGASDVVRLRGLTINAQGGVNGIVANTVGLLEVADVRVSGFSNRGLDFAATGGRLSVTDSEFADNGNAGLHAQSAGLSTVTIHRSRFDHNASNGAVIATHATGAIFDSVASNNGSTGFMIDAGGSASLAGCKVSDTNDLYSNYGVLVRGASTHATIARCDVYGAFLGFTAQNGAYVQISDSTAQTGGAGFGAEEAGSVMAVDRGSAANSQVGFRAFASSGTATLRMSNCNSAGNNYGVYVGSGGVVETRQNNTIRGNTTDVNGSLTTYGAM